MKILKLELCCFGPYVKKQVIDFKNLNQSRLYLVTGDTGAGKTILFDAIAFCLYGDSSGGVRKAVHFRSQNAPADMETYAKLTFEIHQEIYEIKRSPSYPREGKKTNKAHTVELKMPNGEIYERPGDVSQKIKEIIGIDYEEFTSVVMIAQGRFDALIRASSKDKEAILREIFHTHEKRQLQERIAKKASDLKSETTIKKATLDTLIKQYNFSEEDYLGGHLFEKMDDLLNESKRQLDNCLKEKTVLEVKQKEVETNYQFAQKRFDLENQLKNKSETLVNLKQDKEVYEKKEEKLQLLKKAMQLKPSYETLCELETQLLGHEKEAEHLAVIKENLQATCAKLEKEYASHLESKQAYLDNQASINELEKKKTAYMAYEKLKNEAMMLKKDIEALVLKQNSLHEQVEKNNAEKEKLESQCRCLEPVGEVALIVERLENEMKLSYDLYEQMLLKTKELELLKKTQMAKEKLWQKDFAAYENKNHEYLQATRLYLASSAKILASTLEEGQPCPVCGSLHHPALASFDGKKIDKDVLDALKEEVEKLRVKQEKSHSELLGNQAKIEALFEQMKVYDLEALNKDYQLKKESYESKKEAFKKLEELTKSLNATLDKIKDEQGQLETSLKDVENKLLSLDQQYHLVQGKLEGMQVKETSLEKIEQLLLDLNNKVAAYERNEAKLSKALEKEKTALTKASVSYHHHQEAYDKLKPRYENHKATFETKMHASFKHLTLFEEALENLEGMERLEKEIQIYKQNLEVLKLTIKQIKEQLEQLPKLDLSKINEKKREIKTSYEGVLNAITKLKNTLDLLKEGYGKLEKASKEFETINEKKDQVVHLSSVLNGQNKLRMTFESYILSSYFDEILQLANIRLKMMTNGRYMLVRSKENQGGNKLQGLDILVLDYESGKLRDIHSLSGGETFKAALCLALGLSDMMSAKSGSIQIDTLFIDEGFGSLDEKSLDSAIEALSDLQNEGKIIGIISHVSELKERIDAKIVVRHNQEGSNATVVLA